MGKRIRRYRRALGSGVERGSGVKAAAQGKLSTAARFSLTPAVGLVVQLGWADACRQSRHGVNDVLAIRLIAGKRVVCVASAPGVRSACTRPERAPAQIVAVMHPDAAVARKRVAFCGKYDTLL